MPEQILGFTILRKLGEGARSQVYQAVRPETGEIIALKRVSREPHEDGRFLEQAVFEFELSRKFDHPCLRKSIELFRVRKLLKLAEVVEVMEFVDGVSLDKRRPDRIDGIVDLFIKVADGLGAMHRFGYLHTDIKPNNILLTADNSIKIIDFGQSCPIGHRKPRIQGTPDYIAPEQADRAHLSRQTDVFNLGATLYWALTGQTYPTVITRKTKDNEPAAREPKLPPTPQEINPEIPAILSRFVMEACAFDPRERPRDMKAVIDRLETAHHVLITRARTGHDLSTHADEQRAKADAPPPRPPSKLIESYDYSAFRELFTADPDDPDPKPPEEPS